MNKIKYLLMISIAIGIFAIAGCDDENTVDPVQEVTNRVSSNWVIDLNNTTSQVLFGTEDRTDTYGAFELTLTEGNYSTVEVDVLDPWPNLGTWEFTNTANVTDPNQNNFSITRGDGLVMDVTLSQDDSVMEIKFTYDQTIHEGERVAAVDGEWTFVLVAGQ